MVHTLRVVLRSLRLVRSSLYKTASKGGSVNARLSLQSCVLHRSLCCSCLGRSQRSLRAKSQSSMVSLAVWMRTPSTPTLPSYHSARRRWPRRRGNCAMSRTQESAVRGRLCPLSLPKSHQIEMAETTPGVYQASGYGDLATDQSIWYLNLHYPGQDKI